MKTAIAFLALIACAVAGSSAAASVTYAGYWDFDSSDCSSTAETDTTFGDGLQEGYFFPVSQCTIYNYIGYDMFYYAGYNYIFTCNDTHIAYVGYEDDGCTDALGSSYNGAFVLDNCATDKEGINYACITEWPSPDDFDNMDILDPEGGDIEVTAALNYFNDTTCGSVVSIVGGGYKSCQFPYHTYCDGGDLYIEYCLNTDGNCNSGCSNDGTEAPDGPLVDGTCYTSSNLPTGWDSVLTYNVFEVELDSYYTSANLLTCQGSGSSDAVATTVSFGLVALAAALAF
jgi:hypothetical protein